jgi:hypothetical protein
MGEARRSGTRGKGPRALLRGSLCGVAIVALGVASCRRAPLAAGSQVSSTVTPTAGGMIALPDGTARLAVPAGAVTSETTITVTMTNAAAPPGGTADGAVFKFEPDGLVFAKPVAVTLAFSSSVHPTVYWSNAVGGYDQIGGSVERSAITAEVMHFSSGFVGELATDSGTDGGTSGTGGPGGSVGGGGVGANLGTGGPGGSVGSGGASGSLGNDGCAGIGFPRGSMSTADPCGAFTMPNPASAGLPNPVAYVRNADGTVTDNVTARTWEGSVAPGSYTQAQAITYCSNKGGGWRLPTRLEMVSLVDFTIAPPGAMINQTYFTNTPADVFWTSSKFVGISCTGWDVSTADGSVTSADNHGARRVRCVLAAAPKCYPARYQTLPGGLSPRPGHSADVATERLCGRRGRLRRLRLERREDLLRRPWFGLATPELWRVAND